MVDFRFPDSNPSLWTIPDTKDPSFVGRVGSLKKLKNMVMEVPSQGTKGTGLVYGNEGVGKSRLLEAFCQQHQADYDVGWWIDLRLESDMSGSLDRLADHVGLTGVRHGERLHPDMESWFSNQDRWVLVVDHIADVEDVLPFLPAEGKGHCLLGARSVSKEFPLMMLCLDSFSLSDAALFVKAMLPDISKEDRDLLLEEVGRNPKHVYQTCHYIALNQIAVSDYCSQSEVSQEDGILL